MNKIFLFVLSLLVMVSMLLSALGDCAAEARYGRKIKEHRVWITHELSISYRIAGNGNKVILLVPGWTMSGAVFERQLAHFQNSETYKVIAIDPRSHGESSKTSTGNTYEQHGRDLHAFMKKLDLQKVVLVGWSNGVFDVMSYVHQYKAANLRALVLIDGTPKCSGDDNELEWVWYRRDDADGYKQYWTQNVLHDRQNFTREFATWMLEDPADARIEWITDISSQTPDEVAALLNKTSAYLDYSDDLRAQQDQLPLLYVVRSEWGSVVSGWAQQNTPSATVEALGKHMMFWERSEAFNAILDEFRFTVN